MGCERVALMKASLSSCPCSPVHTCVKAPAYDRLIAHGREWASSLQTKGSGGFHTHGTLEPPVSGAGHTLQLDTLCAKPRRWSRHGWPHYMCMVYTHNRDPLTLVIMERK